MTEIPEHLLKRSRERRAAMGGGGGGEEASSSAPAPAGSTAPAAATPAVPARPAAPVPVVAPPPKPDPSYVRAYKERKKIPFWAMLPLSLMPVWAFMYVRSVQDQHVTVKGPLAIGETTYGKCSSCHGGSGEGGSGRKLNAGEVLKTFPAIEDQIRWVALGTAKYQAAGVKVYGNPSREGGVHETGSFGIMPGWSADIGGELTDAQVLAVVCYVRYDLGGADRTTAQYEAEFAKWCAPDSQAFADLEAGKTFADPEFAAVGTTPKEGSATPTPATT